MRKYLMIPILAMLVLSFANAASVNASISAFLGRYGVPTSMVNSSAYNTISYNSTDFLVMQSGNQYLIINLAQQYSFVTNYSVAYPVMQQFVLGKSTFNSSAISALDSNATSLVKGSQSSLNKCLVYTGLNNSKYLTTNSYAGCYTVGSCYQSIANATKSPLIEKGIVNLSENYNLYNSSYNSLISLSKSINSNNYYLYISNITLYSSRIAAVPYALQHNQLFSVPGNFTYGLFANCPVFPTPQILQSSPWYCQMLSYCSGINFNYTNVRNIKSIVSNMQSTLVSQTEIASKAKNATTLAYSFIEPYIVKENTSSFDNFVNSTKSAYAAAMSNATALNKKVLNGTLLNATAKLNATYTAILSKGINQNITLATEVAVPMISSLSSLTSKVSKAYYSVYNNSFVNQGALLEAQLDNPNSPAVAALAVKQQNIENAFAKPVPYSELSSINANITAIKEGLASISVPFSMGLFVKGLDSWFVNPLSAAFSSSVQSEISSAPFFAALLSFIIGIIIILVVYLLTYHRLKKHRKIHHAKQVSRSWEKLFAIMFVIVLIYAYLTYAFASEANSSLPLNSFISLVNSSKSVTLLVNQTSMSNASISMCVSSLKSEFASQNKTVSVVTEKGFICNIASSSSLVNPDCIGSILASGTPVVFISGGSTSQIAYKGLFGNMLYASGSATQGSSCLVSTMFKK